MALIQAPDGTWKDTNDQSARADLRKQGYYIDSSGVYAPGAGARSGDTFSGTQATKNVAPSGTQLPIINGTPVSPSNGATGPATGAIMYRTDPLYASTFGPGTPGYTATSQQANAAPLPADPNQQSLTQFNAATAPPPAGARAPGVTNAANVPANNPAGPAIQAASATDQAAWQAGITGQNASGSGFGPYAAAEVPELTDQGTYTENGKVIKKSVDQYGNPYYQQVGTSSEPVPAAPGTPDKPADAPPPKEDPTAGGTLIPKVVQDKLVYVPKQVADQIDADAADKKAQAHELVVATQKATAFDQQNKTDQINISRAIAAGTDAHNKAMEQQASAAQAQLAMHEAMQDNIAQQAADLAKQNLEANKAAQAQTALYQQQQIETTRAGQAQQNSIEQEKLALARRQSRGRRGLPQVRYA